MSAYLVGMMTVTNPARYADYRSQVLPLLQQHGGRFLVRGGAIESLEGQPTDKRLVIAEFPSMDALHAFWDSPEYKRIGLIRREASESIIWAVPGA